MQRQRITFVDANVIVRYLIEDTPSLFTKAKEFFDKVIDGSERATITESVLAECVYVLGKVYGVSRTDIAESLSGVLTYKGIVGDDVSELKHALGLYRDKSKLDIVDCIIIAKAAKRGDGVLSFDKALNAAKNFENH